MEEKKVCVFGSYRSLGPKREEGVVMLGRLLAEKGFVVVSGGFSGTMEDISRGAKEAGGKTIGVTYYKRFDPSGKAANRYIDEEIRTKNLFERIDTMMEISDAFIVLPGGTGTLLELAACLEHINKGIGAMKPIVALGDFWKCVLERLVEEPVLNEAVRSKFGTLSCRDLVTFVRRPEDAAREIKERCLG